MQHTEARINTTKRGSALIQTVISLCGNSKCHSEDETSTGRSHSAGIHFITATNRFQFLWLKVVTMLNGKGAASWSECMKFRAAAKKYRGQTEWAECGCQIKCSCVFSLKCTWARQYKMKYAKAPHTAKWKEQTNRRCRGLPHAS
jgi:hypothetical protein